jgi:hypothetical protein
LSSRTFFKRQKKRGKQVVPDFVLKLVCYLVPENLEIFPPNIFPKILFCSCEII